MGWIAAIAVLILLVVSRGFRKVALVLVVACGVVGGFFYLKNEHEEAQSLTRISQTELTFENVLLKPSYSTYSMVGRITNRSPRYTLKQVDLVVTLRDCKAGAMPPACVVIGESRESMYVDIPAGQARDFDESVYFSGGPPKPQGQLSWDYRVESIKAKEHTS